MNRCLLGAILSVVEPQYKVQRRFQLFVLKIRNSTTQPRTLYHYYEYLLPVLVCVIKNAGSRRGGRENTPAAAFTHGNSSAAQRTSSYSYSFIGTNDSVVQYTYSTTVPIIDAQKPTCAKFKISRTSTRAGRRLFWDWYCTIYFLPLIGT